VSDPVSYSAVLPVGEETVLFVSRLLAAERVRRGTRRRRRALGCYRQAVLVLRGALLAARAAGHPHITVDGTLIRTERVRVPGGPPGGTGPSAEWTCGGRASTPPTAATSRSSSPRTAAHGTSSRRSGITCVCVGCQPSNRPARGTWRRAHGQAHTAETGSSESPAAHARTYRTGQRTRRPLDVTGPAPRRGPGRWATTAVRNVPLTKLRTLLSEPGTLLSAPAGTFPGRSHQLSTASNVHPTATECPGASRTPPAVSRW
jgi:hypothetical protein